MAERTNSQLLGATLLGGAIGAGVALLFAPRSGKETRQLIHDNMAQKKANAKEAFDHAKSRLSERLESGKEMKDRLTESARKTGRVAKEEMDSLKQEARTKKGKNESPVLSAWEKEV